MVRPPGGSDRSSDHAKDASRPRTRRSRSARAAHRSDYPGVVARGRGGARRHDRLVRAHVGAAPTSSASDARAPPRRTTLPFSVMQVDRALETRHGPLAPAGQPSGTQADRVAEPEPQLDVDADRSSKRLVSSGRSGIARSARSSRSAAEGLLIPRRREDLLAAAGRRCGRCGTRLERNAPRSHRHDSARRSPARRACSSVGEDDGDGLPRRHRRVYDSTGGVAWPHVESRYTVAASPSTDGCGTSAGAGAGTGTTSTGHGAR
jgi:hypothetical protein